MNQRTVTSVAVLVALAGASASTSVGWRSAVHDHPRTQAAWAFQSDDTGALARHADAIFIGRAGAVRPSRTAYADNGEDRLDFAVTTFDVTRGFKGARKGQQIAVERIAADLVDFDGGAFDEGREYLLFVKSGEAGTYYQINDESRFEVSSGRLRAAVRAQGAAARLHGRSVDDISAAIAGQ